VKIKRKRIVSTLYSTHLCSPHPLQAPPSSSTDIRYTAKMGFTDLHKDNGLKSASLKVLEETPTSLTYESA